MPTASHASTQAPAAHHASALSPSIWTPRHTPVSLVTPISSWTPSRAPTVCCSMKACCSKLMFANGRHVPVLWLHWIGHQPMHELLGIVWICLCWRDRMQPVWLGSTLVRRRHGMHALYVPLLALPRCCSCSLMTRL